VPRPRALFVTPVTPAHAGNGLAMRAGLFATGLARAYDVRVLVVPGFDPGRAALLADRVAAEAAGCDAVHVLRLYLAPVLDRLLEQPGRPRITLDVDDFESATRRALGQQAEALRYARMEAHYLPRVDRVIAASRQDAAALGGVAIGNAVPLPAGEAEPAARHDLVFVGNLSYGPNIEAARWLCTEVLPRLARVSAALVGSSPPPALEGLGATVAPDVPDVAPWYAGARIAVAPLLHGGGTATKVLEALAHRRPVVATSRGARDVPEGVVVADTAEAFAAACRRLLDDPAAAAALAERGERWVREHASLDVVAGRVASILAA
jgi:glycosyltransferase involved in cell wall biosynthesis